jgi:hypothetical protein
MPPEYVGRGEYATRQRQRIPKYLLCSLDEGVALTRYRRGNTTPAGPGGRGGLGKGNKRVLDKNDHERLLPRDYKY